MERNHTQFTRRVSGIYKCSIIVGYCVFYLNDKEDSRGRVKCSVVEGDDGRAVLAKQVPNLKTHDQPESRLCS